ncbi:MAG: single-stranded DNA-binding protein [Campylobacteraceae bacterium]|jgi:single-strand DNA-binding protein|nr:single-stranded DNA-binding protein [Campylobacteraceae bacterium]
MLNKVLLIGNTTRAIELRYLPSGSAVAKTGLAVNRTWKDKNTGEKKDETMFIDIVIYGKSAEIANQYMLKGKKVLVEGRLVLEQWVDQSGQKRSKHVLSVESFQFLDSKSSEGGFESGGEGDFSDREVGYSKPANSQAPRVPEIDIQDDEIPF